MKIKEQTRKLVVGWT